MLSLFLVITPLSLPEVSSTVVPSLVGMVLKSLSSPTALEWKSVCLSPEQELLKFRVQLAARVFDVLAGRCPLAIVATHYFYSCCTLQQVFAALSSSLSVSPSHSLETRSKQAVAHAHCAVSVKLDLYYSFSLSWRQVCLQKSIALHYADSSHLTTYPSPPWVVVAFLHMPLVPDDCSDPFDSQVQSKKRPSVSELLFPDLSPPVASKAALVDTLHHQRLALQRLKHLRLEYEWPAPSLSVLWTTLPSLT